MKIRGKVWPAMKFYMAVKRFVRHLGYSYLSINIKNYKERIEELQISYRYFTIVLA